MRLYSIFSLLLLPLLINASPSSSKGAPLEFVGHERIRTRQQVVEQIEKLKAYRESEDNKRERFFFPHFLDDAPWIDLIIGEPRKLYTLNAETGHSLTWLIDPTYKNLNDWQDTYDPNKSKTSKNTGKVLTGFSAMFNLTGQQYVDQIEYNRTLEWKQAFGLISKVSNFGTQPELPVSGILGLSWNNTKISSGSNGPNEQASFILNALSDYPAKRFSLWQQRYIDQEIIFSDSHLELGEIDQVNCKQDAVWVPISYSPQNQVQFSIDAFAYKKYSTFRSFTAFLDTGFPVVTIPDAYFRIVFNDINPSFDTTLGLYTIECIKLFDLSPVKFTIGGRDFVLEGKDYVLDTMLPDDQCVFALDNSKGYPENSAFVFGGVFSRRYCSLFNVDEEKIGFATAIHKED